MITVNIHQAKTQLSALLCMVQNDKEHILICRSGLPIAEIIPYQKKKRTTVKMSLVPTSVKFDLTQPISEDWLVE